MWTLERRNGTRAPVEGHSPLDGLVGESAAFVDAMTKVEAVLAGDPLIMLLEGETGTGKTLLARATHFWRGMGGQPLLVVSSGGLPPWTLEEELFGDPISGRPGVLALVQGGTVVLDDIDRVPDDVQDRLASFVSGPSGTLRPRIVATTRRLPVPEQGERSLAPALLAQLDGAIVTLPPLRRRVGDVKPLARETFRRLAGEDSGRPIRLEPDALEALHAYMWPGNVRELQDVLRRAAEVAPGRTIRGEHLRIRTRDTRSLSSAQAAAVEMILVPPQGKSWERIEAEAVRATLAITGGNRSQASRILGISRPTLARKIRKYNLARRRGQ